jgi:hypothetical protein
MGFRIHRGIFQKLNAERTAYENTFKIDADGRIKEVDSEGNVTAGYLKVGEQATDADTVDGFHATNAAGGLVVLNSSNGYWNAPSWVHFNEGRGIYSTHNGAHFLPNNQGQYVAWRMIGSRNGWEGLHFGNSSGMTLMMNQGESGVHRNGSGWKYRHQGGKFYVHDGTNGGGTAREVWHTGTFTTAHKNALINTLGITGLPYTCDIVLNGDPDMYYPVHFYGGNQDVWRRIIIRRGYGEQAPWDPIGTGSHRGGLLLDWEGNFGGWGGAQYSDRLRVLNQSYTDVVADMYRTTHSMGYTFFLRGGGDSGAIYHIYSDQPINGYGTTGVPQVGYSTDTLFYNHSNESYRVNAPAALSASQINTTRLNQLKTLKRSEMDALYQPVGSYLTTTGKAADSNLLDGIDSGSFIRSDASDNVTGHTEWQDNYQIRLGAGADLRIWHDGNNHVFRSYHHGANYYFQLEDNEGTNRNGIIIQGDTSRSYVRLYEDGAERFRTKSTGVEVLGEVRVSNGIRSTSSDGYGIIRGYDNDNHFITIRGAVETGTSTLTITGGHQTTFVEHANEANEGWYFVSKASGSYTEMARIDGVGQMYIGGNKVWHAGNDGASSGLDADTVDGYHASRLFRIDSATSRGPDFNALMPSANETYYKEVHAINEGSNIPTGAYTYGVVQSTYMGSMKLQWYVPHTASRGNSYTQDTIYFRTNWGGGDWYGWKYLIHSGNIAGQSVNYATTAGSANAVTWGNVSGKPSTFAPSSHNHNKITENSTISFGQGSLQWTDLNGNGGDGLNGNTPGNPFNDWHHHIIMNHSNSNGYYVDVAYSFHHDRVHFRRKAGSDPQSWREFWHTGNLSTTKVSNWDTAYGWGDHSTQGYLDTVPEEYKTQTQNDARYAAIAHNHSGVYDPAGTAQSVSDDLEPRIAAVETTASRNETNIAAKANLAGSYGQDFKADDMRVDQWFRNTVSGKGLYNDATGNHWYSDSSSRWRLRSGSSTDAWLLMATSNNATRGSFYATSSNEVGILDADNQWAVKVVHDSHVELRDNNETVFTAGQGGHSSNYGTVCTHGGGRGGWEGYSINGRFVWMSSDNTLSGIYNDLDNEWMTQYHRNGAVKLYHNGGLRVETQSGGARVHGTMTATAFVGDGSALTGLPAQTPPITTTVEGGEASTLASIHFSPGEGAATFTMADGSSYRLAFAR